MPAEPTTESVTPGQGWPALAVLVVVAAVAAVTWPYSKSAAPPAAAGPVTVSVSRSACGQGWTTPHAGSQTLLLRNTGDAGADADLVDPATGKVYGEVESLGQNTTQPLSVDLAPGKYAIRCLVADVDPITGPVVTVPGQAGAAGSPGVVVVTQNDLLGPLARYQGYVTAGVATLVTRTDALAAAARSGDVAAARAAWLPAHLSYERLGAAYDAFGDLDGEINGSTAGLPDGVDDPGFTGFHRVEYDLWHGVPPARLTADADALSGFVHGLQADLPQQETQAIDLGLRAHEIMENALQFELNARTDEGSGTSLATVEAELAGDREVISVLRPVLTGRYPRLSEVDEWSGRLETLLQAQHHPDGSWTPVARLDPAAREELNGTLGELIELLAPIAVITEPRRANS